jgi:hypothetical protein
LLGIKRKNRLFAFHKSRHLSKKSKPNTFAAY